MRRIVILAAVAVVASIAVPVPSAQAEHEWGHCDTKIKHPSDPDRIGAGAQNSYACEWWNNWARWCDYDVDGHGVRAWLDFGRGTVIQTAWAPRMGCEYMGTAWPWGNIHLYRVCVEQEGCSAWKSPYD